MYSELTEITESREMISFRGWIFYDQDCRFCSDLARRFTRIFARRGFKFEPLQQPWVQYKLGLTPAEALSEMRVLTREGAALGGADAMVFLARQLWWTRPVALLASVPPFHAISRRFYKWVAAHRPCRNTGVGHRSLYSLSPWLPIAVLPALALCTKPLLPPWGFMWVMAIAIFLGCKWLTLSAAKERSPDACPFRATAYLFLWPGMDAARFLSWTQPRWRRLQLLKDAAFATGRILLGAALLFGVARHAQEPLLAGWIGMAGMVLLLHFGLFHLSSVGWRALRIDAAPIMDAPLRSTSLSEFWGRRWNGAFNQLALNLIFRPLARRTGIIVAALCAFFISGLAHEMVISLPAGAGYGLPAFYFLLQGVGVLAEHSRAGKWLGLDRGFSGRIFTIVIAAAPAFWLFHPPFVHRVILPFMQAIRAL